MDKVKVLFFVNSIDVGGVKNALINVFNSLDNSKYDITLITLFETTNIRNFLPQYVKYKRVFPFMLRGYSRILKFINNKVLYKLFIHNEYDIEIACVDGIPARIITGSNNIDSKKILWFHNDVSQNTATNHCFKDMVERKSIYEKYNLLWFVSNGSMQGFNKLLADVKTEKRVIYNPFFIENIRLRAKEKIVENIIDSRFTFCSVGRLSSEKGFVRLIKAFSIVNKKVANTKLMIIGEGIERQKIENEIKKYNLSKSVYLLGEKTNPLPYIYQSNCYVCSSITEALSTTVIEATILEKPTITMECAGMKDILGESEFGIIVDQNVEDLANAMLDIIIDKEKYNIYKTKLFERAQIFSEERFRIKFNKIIEEYTND